ncbi:hypothetical protein BJX99DRAFT_202749 [Aspergillus californicus]
MTMVYHGSPQTRSQLRPHSLIIINFFLAIPTGDLSVNSPRQLTDHHQHRNYFEYECRRSTALTNHDRIVRIHLLGLFSGSVLALAHRLLGSPNCLVLVQQPRATDT